MVSYFEDISVFTKIYSSAENPIKEYFKTIKQYIGLSYKEINKALGHRKAEHTFYTNDAMQFSLCTETVYQELIEKFHIDEFQVFIPYADLKEMNRKFERTFNLPENEKYVSNVFEFPKEGKRYHPTQKPVLLLERLINIYSNKGDIVLDNCMGSGSTGVACMNTGRNFIGIEKEESYFKIAQERIAEAQSFQLLNA